jgi:hypothetical protein
MNTQQEVDYLRYELDQYREAEHRRLDEEQEQRERRVQKRKKMREEQLRTASNWYQALVNQATLLSREASIFVDECSSYFSDGADACSRALELWREEEEKRQKEIEALEQQIATIKAEIKVAVGERLAQESNTEGWREVARALREEDNPQRWLNW